MDLDCNGHAPIIPGGPKIHRTPVPVRPATSQRTQGTPHSVRSMRNPPQRTTPASRHQGATPVSAARPSASAATYPLPDDDMLGRLLPPR